MLKRKQDKEGSGNHRVFILEGCKEKEEQKTRILMSTGINY